ncbi:MAG: hypothetical protein IPM64_05160 [Phycisphaerales bacterium]|nr:hypothetical protein [Phycisphaerales bacterium]
MAKSARRGAPPAVVIFGDEEFQKAQALEAALEEALPAGADRALAVCDLDATMSEDSGGPSLAGVLTDLRTLPFLTERRVVIIRDADKFISAHRERLEHYVRAASETGTLILICRSFPHVAAVQGDRRGRRPDRGVQEAQFPGAGRVCGGAGARIGEEAVAGGGGAAG